MLFKKQLEHIGMMETAEINHLKCCLILNNSNIEISSDCELGQLVLHANTCIKPKTTPVDTSIAHLQ